MRETMILTKKLSILDLKPEDSEHFDYFPIKDEDKWKSELLKIMIEERDLGNFDKNDQELINFLCCN